ncbi:NAD(P)/FAD-dependent oxidoreductase [Pseudomonas asiatica]|uniref:NAD(P)/FAD-dependent oxidoreductase n=1 Tax=Pseudomonas asiatica TaxID=2219225 RepID=UPI0018A98758|nr:FAD-dependent oxidoreductase [Pseudomonas asiatica]MBF8803516.1 FAD-dependent oxidoreductase [Pseudomonas asiatica]
MSIPSSSTPIVIVGGGLASVSAAEALREEGYEGKLVLISDEPHIPYDRPPLSKAVLKDQELPSNFNLKDLAFYEANKIELKLNSRVASVNPEAKSLTLANGEQIAYAKLLIGTGSRVRELPILPKGSSNVHYLRTLEDALALKSDFDSFGSSGRVAIIGAGIIGLEVAAVAADLGLEITVLEAGSRPLGRSASQPLASFLESAHKAKGVKILCNTAVETVEKTGAAYQLSLSNGDTLIADIICVGIGVLPNMELAQDSGIECSPHGIHVDSRGSTSADHVYAIGEVTYHFNDRHQAYCREETWQHAANHGAHVARAVLGKFDPYEELMSYWTDQYEYNIQVIGSPIGQQDVIRGDVISGSFLIFHLDDHEIRGITAVNAARDLRRVKSLLASRTSVAPEVLQDLSIDLTKLS